MRYPTDHKERTRQQLLEDSGRHVKKHGFAASGVDAIAASAGITSGALYKHFAGKSDLFAAVVAAELERTASRFAAVQAGDRAAAKRALAAYLSPAHVRAADAGCPLPALTAEITRAEVKVREAFQAGLVRLHAEVEKMTGSKTSAWALIAECVGAVMLARALPDDSHRADLLGAVASDGTARLAAPKRSPKARARPAKPQSGRPGKERKL